jgi:anti-sigma B factor antagonist
MSISHNDVNDSVRRIMISGRLDMEGTDSVGAQLVQLTTAAKKGVVIDLCGVRFLASIGIRSLIQSAKAAEKRGGKVVLLVEDGSQVIMSLKATGIDQMIPIFTNDRDAEKAAAA